MMSADDVMRQTARPALALVRAAMSEDVVGGTQGNREWTTISSRNNFQVRPVRPDTDHAAPSKLDGAAILARGARNALVADSDVENPSIPRRRPPGSPSILPPGPATSGPSPVTRLTR